MVVGQRGSVPMRMELVIRFDYGSIVPWVRRTKTGIRAIAGPDLVELCTPVELRGENLTTVAEFTVSEGQRMPLVLSWQPSQPAGLHCRMPKQALSETRRVVAGVVEPLHV